MTDRERLMMDIANTANELLGLYDWRNDMAAKKKNGATDAEQRVPLMKYGQQKKDAWGRLRIALNDVGVRPVVPKI